jgi:hypothetical protein
MCPPRTRPRTPVTQELRITINGSTQGMFVRQQRADDPLLLFVHGGPGMPEYFLERQHPTRLDELFTVVWWDQRGAGLSWTPHVPRSTMTVDQLVTDTIAVSDRLRERYDRDRIYLLGHSWGSSSASRRPRPHRTGTRPTSGWARWCTSCGRRSSPTSTCSPSTDGAETDGWSGPWKRLRSRWPAGCRSGTGGSGTRPCTGPGSGRCGRCVRW